MGGCLSFDNTPPPPEVLVEDPPVNIPQQVVVAKLGFFGFSRDYGIWNQQRPSSSEEQQKTIWMWFNKSNVNGNIVRIELENFYRGHIPDQPKKGRVLYFAEMTERPVFQVFQRFAGSSMDMIFGLFKGGYQDQGDNYYVQHPSHHHKLNDGQPGELHGQHLISKWSFVSRVQFRDGNMGRGVVFQGQPLILDVFSKGTVVTSYKRYRDEEGNQHTRKIETEFVDRIEFRLSYNGMFMGEWFEEGDSMSYGSNDLTLDSPFFTTIMEGGWFSRSSFRITSKPTMDPALAMLISHVCCTEFSVSEIKSDLKVNSPSHPPNAIHNGFNNFNQNFGFAQPNGNFNMF